MLTIHTYLDIMALGSCYDPAARGLCDRTWQGTALDVLRHPAASTQDKLWLVLREDWIPAPSCTSSLAGSPNKRWREWAIQTRAASRR